MANFGKLMLAAAAAMSCAAAPADMAQSANAAAFVESFCAADLRGNDQRFDFADWSEKSADPEQGVFIATWHSFVIVTRCRVSAVSVQGDHGRAALSCTRVGMSTGRAVIKAESPSTEEVALSLRLGSGRWRVMNPPPPRLRLDAAIEAFEEELARYPGDWESRGTPALKREHQRIATGLAALRELRTTGIQTDGGASCR